MNWQPSTTPPALTIQGNAAQHGERESPRVLCRCADGFAFVGRYVQRFDYEPNERGAFVWKQEGRDGYTFENVTEWAALDLGETA